MVDYREFSRQIKEKYPEYQDVDDLKLANAMIEKYPEYKPQVTFENAELPTIQLNEDGTEKKVLQGQVSKNVYDAIDNTRKFLRPLGPLSVNPIDFDKGLAKGVSSLGVGLGRNITNKYLRPLIGKEPLSDEELNKTYGFLAEPSTTGSEKLGNFVGSAAPYFLMPEFAPLKGTSGAINLGNKAINLGTQGAVVGGLEGLKNDGLQGLGSGAIGGGLVGGLIGGGLPLIGKGIPTISKKVLKGMAQIEPETIEQVIKPDSNAFQLNSNAKLMDFANSVTNRVRNTYNDILKNRAKEVGNAAKKLDDTGKRINVADVFNDLDEVHNNYQYGRGNFIDDINPNIARQNKNIILSRLTEPGDVLEEIGQTQKPDFYSKAKENEAYDILSKAVNKPINWLKSQLKAVTGNKGVAKRAESIEELLDKVDDKLDVSKSSNYGDLDYRYYDNRFLNGDDANAGYNLARQAYDDIVNNNFVNEVRDPMSRVLDSAEQDYRFILRNVLENSGDSNAYGNALTKLEQATKNLPQELQEEYANRFINDTQRIYEETQTVTPYELLGIRRSLGEKTPFGVEGAGQLNEYKQRIYGKITDRLHKLSPELERADRRYSAVKKYQDTKEGTKRILQQDDNIDKSTTALDNFNTSYSKGNTNKNVQDLENLFVREGYEPFINDIEDIVAARDLNKLNNTGLGSLADVAKNVLVRPSLMGLQAINKTPLPRIIEGVGSIGQRSLIPFGYNLPRLFDYEEK